MPQSKIGGVNALGKLIATQREALSMSPADLARKTGITSAQISRLEAGERSDPHLSTLIALSKALGLSVDAMAQAASRPPGIMPPADSDDDETEVRSPEAASTAAVIRSVEAIRKSLLDLLPHVKLPADLRQEIQGRLGSERSA